MALEVEDGTGKADADAYVDLAFVDAYAADYGLTLLGATDAEKEVHVRKATQYLDAFYGGRWRGKRTVETQSLDWPRMGARVNGYLLDDDQMPTILKQACAEAACRISSGEDMLPDLDEPGLIGSTDEQIGPMREAITYIGGRNPLPEFPKIAGLLRPLITAGDRVVRA